MKLIVEFGFVKWLYLINRGGMDVLFNNRKTIVLDESLSTVQDLIIYLKDKELSERAELFVDGTNL